MAPLQKSECPLAGGQVAKLDTENTAIVAPHGDEEKVFATLRAQFALHGHALNRTCPSDGPVCFYVARGCMVRYLPTLDDARRFLAQIGGAP